MPIVNTKDNPNEKRFENMHLFPKILSKHKQAGGLVDFERVSKRQSFYKHNHAPSNDYSTENMNKFKFKKPAFLVKY